MTKKEIDALYAKLGRWLAETVCDCDSWMGDFDGQVAGEKMVELGLLVEVPYDPDSHGEIYFYHDPEPGDDVQIFAKGCEP